MRGPSSGEPSALNSVMTRRQLLQRFGMIGGSSLVLGTMNAWELMATPSGTRPELSGAPSDTRVIILGAGMSGLVTGYELGKLGYRYQILEARDRVGGLNWTVKRGTEHTELGPDGERQVCQFDDGQYLNAGPWRIPHTHRGVLGYCKELGVRLEQFIDDNVVMFSEDPSLGPLANRKVYLRELKSDLWGQTSELLAKATNQGALDGVITAEDKERLVEFLVHAGYLNGPDQVYQADVRMRGSGDAYDLGILLRSPFANQVRSLTAGTGGPDPVFQPTGGMMELALAFERVMAQNITRGAIVEQVRQTADGVRVVYRDARSGDRHEVTGDYVVSCLPMSILKTLEVDFSPDMAAAVAANNHASQAKMGLQMKRRFWEEDDGIYGGHLLFGGYTPGRSSNAPAGFVNPIPQFSYPSNDYHSPKGVLLGFYGNARIPDFAGTPLGDAPITARVEHVLTHASKVHPQIRAEFENAYSVWWDRVPFSEGAWAGRPGENRDRLGTPDGRIYVGSAALSADPSWIEGAVESAWHTVRSIHERAMLEA